ncbi:MULTISPECIES: holo-ACP synthase [Thermoactinomyces]|uniref:Holo-[acyl-carrier-protein] synthase n=1 Tax=Thermoactinomyces daqus TaxID=1329516 RepID=A0A7W1XCF9_9BACL|nr:holo-ACP synthase [Thermoactinomyces daqus]MBA4544131.1 holo-ACP synthase [Thermoactinomyces daqus]MBH8599519.1 holo-ACP synthase [Thermoactinomyces sp. CICC 10523]MBH8605438.1 holo-ACP synthase [Thermoactinomyces sp. CICC 10522]MBH8608968.1 holo-ACP synthase [Thermoactinomyces sp. CICC 10521]
MIRGIGTDLVELERIEEIGVHRLARRILTERERTLKPEQPGRELEYIAGRFAAKEAVAKALGTGIGGNCSFLDIEILNDHKGKPCVFLSESAFAAIFADKEIAVHLSISHSRQYAMAMAVIEEVVL